MKEIRINEFPESTFVELPAHYRKILFQLSFLNYSSATKLVSILKEKGLSGNVFRWRRGHDRGLDQFTHLKTLLYLLGNSQKQRTKIGRLYQTVRQTLTQQKRIVKTPELIELVLTTRSVVQGYSSLAKITEVNQGTLTYYVNNDKIKKVPRNFVEKLIKFSEKEILRYKFSIQELESMILSYKAHHGKKIIPNKLPIHVTAEFESLLFHLLGDGHVREVGSSEYTQLNKIGRRNFLNKLHSCFGHFAVSKKSYSDGRVLIPKIIVDLICNYYHFSYRDFGWNVSKLPKNLSNKKDYKIAGLAAFIVDEGHVSDRGIEIYSANKQLLQEIRLLAQDLSLSISPMRTKKPNKASKQSYRFRIRAKSSRDFQKMVLRLSKEFSNCSLAQKSSANLS